MIIQGKIPGTEALVNITLGDEKVVRIEPHQRGASFDTGDTGGADLYLWSGFFDPQVNGFAGVDFNSPHLTPAELHQAACSLASTGVTGFFPTLITSSHERTARQLNVISEALKNDSLLQEMCLGIHLEGPYISIEEGPRGVHPREFVRLPQWEELERFQEICEGRIKCVTLAPELKGAVPFIEKAVAHGVVIGLGHTNASEELIEEAVKAGARLSCHLGNATPKSSLCRWNLIQKQLMTDQLTATIIPDGIHLPCGIVKDYVRTKGIDRIVLTTDCMAGAGASPGRYTLGDLEVEVGSDRAARLIGNSRLAGSSLTMDRAISNVIHFAEIDLASAIQMASQNAQKLFPEVKGEVIPGHSGNLVLFTYQKELSVQSTWINGEKVF
jgi:N-acetylglucosamine-6-phosphate deacetylase